MSVLGDHKVRKRFKKHHDVKVRVVLAGFGAHGLYDRRDKGGRVLGKEVPHFLGFIFQKKDNRETEHRAEVVFRDVVVTGDRKPFDFVECAAFVLRLLTQKRRVARSPGALAQWNRHFACSQKQPRIGFLQFNGFNGRFFRNGCERFLRILRQRVFSEDEKSFGGKGNSLHGVHGG